MRWIGIVRILVIVFTLLSTWYFAETIISLKWGGKSLQHLFNKQRPPQEEKPKKIHHKCGNEKDCPKDYFPFKIITGAANVVGPTICFDDKILMSSVKNNIGRGLNIVLLNASTGELLHTGHFDMYSGDIKEVKKFLGQMKDGTLILVASFDDPGTKMDDETRKLFASYGSSYANKVGFRDCWIFIGGQGIKNKSPFEQHIKNNKETNKYDGWPEVLEMEGCIPRKKD